MTSFLALETATDVCDVALFIDGIAVAERRTDRPKSHAAELVPMIRDCLREKALEPKDLQAIAVSAGPGSYTGLRIGVSTAKGLAYATDARIIAVSTLEAIASSGLKSPVDAVISVLPSRGGEIYLAAYKLSETKRPVQKIQECAISVSVMLERLAEAGITSGLVVGPSAIRLAGELDSHMSFEFRDEAASANNVGNLAILRLKNEEFEDTSDFEPYYLRTFEARKPARSIFDRIPF